ncbi:type 1 glutamine amidotransferase domain-containing protein [Actinoplanes sp. ATCC 53533]|uniref:type 1 glutamine amidotransferase domain-containing protein n=1 Tax=Actinoplanes sp. ATCC 53533 TaxID=1288362 RepID=UPI000F78FFD4|nr:type 1 glutamine amidotransferase domain-containing protein [Actinoplanes sp. ATCC 53533]RSM58369.1 type 1 glutamine amidotransferase domain-containing protein [Actinoplanes sp. ATCC 53533]
MSSVLLVLSGARVWSLKDGTQRPTGFWAEEFVTPHRLLIEAGHEVTIATPGARVPVADQVSLADAAAPELREYLDSVKDLLASPARLEDVDPAAYDGVFIPGGHGPMQDLAVNPDVARILAAMLPDSGKVVAALCHGPAAFLAAGDAEGNWLFKGRELTAFTDDEEQQAGLADNAPWLLEERLRAGGAVFASGPAWASHVVVDGNLITAQNPASAEAAGRALLAQL